MTGNRGVRVTDEMPPASDPLVTAPGQIEIALETDDTLLGRTLLDVGATTGWHHHNDRDVYGVVLSGEGALEYGPRETRTTATSRDGAIDTASDGAVELTPGGFFHIPAGVVHREANLGEERLVALVALVGSGEQTTAAAPPTEPPETPPRAASREELVSTAELANLTRLTPFPDAPVQQVYGHSSGKMESSWHHHGDNDVLGYVIEGEGYVDLPGVTDDRVLAQAGEFFHIPAGVIHRHVNPIDDEQEYVLWLTGSEPRIFRVDMDDPQ